MDTTIRNLDPTAYRALRARAVLEGRTIGELISEAIRAYLARGTEAWRGNIAGTPAGTFSGGE